MPKKYLLRIFGCQMNYSDAERIETVLNDQDWQQTKTLDSANLVIFITCSVKKQAEDRVFAELHNLIKWKAKKPKRQIGLTGCMVRQTSRRSDSQRDDLLKRSPTLDFVWRIEDTTHLSKLLDEQPPPAYKKTYFSISPTRTSATQASVPIMTGCDNWCTYCIVPITRGREVSRSLVEVVTECQQAVDSGAIEITLLGQNVNSYQKTSGAFAKLLEQVAKIPKLQRLRFTSSHPKDFDASVIDVMARHDNIERHLHLPAQHGADEVLQRMNRDYTATEYLELITKFRTRLPEASVTTDFIVGFPGETDIQFKKLLSFYKEAAFEFAYFSRYSPRPSTAAADLSDQVDSDTKAKRWHILNELMIAITSTKYATLKDKTLDVLVEKCTDGTCEGRSSEFYLVKFPGTTALVGQLVQVKITKSHTLELGGELSKPSVNQ